MKALGRLLVLSMALGFVCLGSAQQNAGPLNAAPGAPNQDPAQPNIATKTSTVVNKKNVVLTESATDVCVNLSKGAVCEMTGINTEKLKGRCRPTSAKNSALTCKQK